MNSRGIAMACVFLAVAITALPADDQVAEALPADIVPETELYIERLHKEASDHVASLMEAGETKESCAKLAMSTLTEIMGNQQNTQRILNSMFIGKICTQRGLAAYNSAKKAEGNAKTKYNSAKKAASKAKSSPIKFRRPVTVSMVKTSGCLDVSKDRDYIKSKKAISSASKKATLDKGKYDNAKKATSDALKAHQKAKVDCACTAQKNYKEVTRVTKIFNSAKNAKAWTKANHINCVLSGIPANKCRVPKVPKVKAPRMPSWVVRTRCSVPSLWKGKTKQCQNQCITKQCLRANGNFIRPNLINQQFMKKYGAGWNPAGCYLGSQINVGEYDYKLGVWSGVSQTRKTTPAQGYFFSATWGITNGANGKHWKNAFSFAFRCDYPNAPVLMYERLSRTLINGGGSNHYNNSNRACRCSNAASYSNYSEIIVKKDGSVEWWFGTGFNDLKKCRSSPPGTAKGSYVVDTSIGGLRSQLSGTTLQVKKGNSWVAAPDAPKA